MSEPVAGNHNDLYDIEVHFEEVVATLEKAEISVDWLFLNADADFDSEWFRGQCGGIGIIAHFDHKKRRGTRDHDHLLYPEIYWERFNFLPFMVLGLRIFIAKNNLNELNIRECLISNI